MQERVPMHGIGFTQLAIKPVRRGHNVRLRELAQADIGIHRISIDLARQATSDLLITHQVELLDQLAIYLDSQPRHRLGLEQLSQTQLNAEKFVYPGGNLSCQQGVKSEQEKIVVGSDALHSQHDRQNLDQPLLGRRTRSAIASVIDAILAARIWKSAAVQL